MKWERIPIEEIHTVVVDLKSLNFSLSSSSFSSLQLLNTYETIEEKNLLLFCTIFDIRIVKYTSFTCDYEDVGRECEREKEGKKRTVNTTVDFRHQ